jgi:hypothetical protein
MKPLFVILSLCLTSTLFISCLNTSSNNISSEDTNRITSDELVYGMADSENEIAVHYIISDATENISRSKLNNSTLQEMFVVYDHLIMSDHQILLFEDQFNTIVKESGQSILPQNDIQEIMDFSFETVLSEEQFAKYNEWRIVGIE